MARQARGFLGDAFHQIAVARDHIGLVVDEAVAEPRIEDALAERHAHGGGDALAKRAGGRLDAGHMAIFGVPGAGAAQLAETADVVERGLRVARQEQQRIEQHRAVAGRQHEAVAVGPMGGRRIEFEELGEQNGRRIGHAHRHAGMAGFGGLDRIHRQGADRVREPARSRLIQDRQHGRALRGSFCDVHTAFGPKKCCRP